MSICDLLLCSGFGQEEEWIDLATVQGYRRMLMCQDVHDEMQLQLEFIAHPNKQNQQQYVEQLQELLLAMCNRRLAPTDWLNKVDL